MLGVTVEDTTKRQTLTCTTSIIPDITTHWGTKWAEIGMRAVSAEYTGNAGQIDPRDIFSEIRRYEC